jgi:hypothetical protein
MIESRCLGRTPSTMTVRELARLRILYEHLARAERWISEVASGADNIQGTGEQVLVYCYAHTLRGEAVIPVLTYADVLCGSLPTSGTTESTSLVLPPPLSDLRGCRLFRELHEDQLNGNWDWLLDIDRIRVELSASRWETSWS